MGKEKILMVFSDIKSEQNYLISYLKDISKQYEIFLSFEKLNYKFNKEFFYSNDFEFLKKNRSKLISNSLLNEVLFCFDLKKIIKILLYFLLKKKFDIYTNFNELKKNISKKKIKFKYIFLNESNLKQEFLDNFRETVIYAFPHSLVLRGLSIEKKRRIKLTSFMNKSDIDIHKNKINFVINFKEETDLLKYKYGQDINIIKSKCNLINEKYDNTKKRLTNNILILLGKETYFSQVDLKKVNSILYPLIKKGYSIILKYHPRTKKRLLNQNKNILEYDGPIKDICHNIDFAIVTSKTNSVLELVSRGIFVIEFYNSEKSTYNNKKYEFLKKNNYVSISNYYGFVKNFSDKKLLLNFLKSKKLNSLISKNRNTQIKNLKNYLKKNYSKINLSYYRKSTLKNNKILYLRFQA